MLANIMVGEHGLTIQAGMDDYLSKPIRVDEWVGVMSRGETFTEKGVL